MGLHDRNVVRPTVYAVRKVPYRGDSVASPSSSPTTSSASSADALGRRTLKDFVPIEGIYPVGRLDRDSEGLLLLTDDGPLAHCLTDPRFEHPKTYLVQVERVPDPDGTRERCAGASS